MLSKLMVYTIETGMVTAISATAELVLWLADHKENWYFVPYVGIPFAPVTILTIWQVVCYRKTVSRNMLYRVNVEV